MKIHILIVLLSFQFFTCSNRTKLANSADRVSSSMIPPVIKAGAEPVLKSMLIYGLDNKPTPECHASTLAETPDGLVCAFFAGKHEGNKDVGIRVSRFKNGSWSWPEEVVNGVQDDQIRYPCWNPVLFQVPQGTLMLFYKVGPSPRAWWGMLVTSENDGKTWSKPRSYGG